MPATVLFSAEMAVRWADLDADGRVNNVQILCFAEEARMRWVAALDLPAAAPALTPVVAAVQCTFHAALKYPAIVRAELRCSRLGRSSLQLECTLFEVADPPKPLTRVADVGVAWVWTEVASGTAHPMPPLLRQRCEAEHACAVPQADSNFAH